MIQQRRLLLASALVAASILTGWTQNMSKSHLLFSVDRSHFADSIPFTFDKGKILIPAVIGGKTYRLLFDTGAARGIIPADSDIPRNGRNGQATAVDGNGAEAKMNIATIPSMQIGRLTITDYPVIVAPTQPVINCFCDGIIGFNLVRKGFAVKIDMLRQLLIITDRKELFNNEPGIPIKYIPNNVPWVKTEPSPKCSDNAIFDTGVKHLYTMSKPQSFDVFTGRTTGKPNRWSEELKDQVVWTGRGPGSSVSLLGVADTNEIVSMRLKCIRIGTLALQNVAATTTTGTSTIGTELLKYGSVIINPFRREIIFQPDNGQDAITVNSRPRDYLITVRDNRPVISIVNKRSDVYRQGMRPGDIIVAANGTTVDDFCTLVNIADKNTSDTITLELYAADGTHRTIACPQ